MLGIPRLKMVQVFKSDLKENLHSSFCALFKSDQSKDLAHYETNK